MRHEASFLKDILTAASKIEAITAVCRQNSKSDTPTCPFAAYNGNTSRAAQPLPPARF